MRYESLSIFLAIRFCHFLHLTLCTPSLQASNLTAPTMSKSGQPIKYAPPTENPLIGHGAPSLADIMAGRKRKSGTKVTTRKLLTRGSSSHCASPSAPSSSAQASSLAPSSSARTPPSAPPLTEQTPPSSARTPSSALSPTIQAPPPAPSSSTRAIVPARDLSPEPFELLH
jgi:hypothetical protein